MTSAQLPLEVGRYYSIVNGLTRQERGDAYHVCDTTLDGFPCGVFGVSDTSSEEIKAWLEQDIAKYADSAQQYFATRYVMDVTMIDPPTYKTVDKSFHRMKALLETRNAIGYEIRTRKLTNAAIALEKKRAYKSEDSNRQFDTNRRREREAAELLQRQMEEDDRQQPDTNRRRETEAAELLQRQMEEDDRQQLDTNRRRETEAAELLQRQMEEDDHQRQEAEKAYRQQEAKEDEAGRNAPPTPEDPLRSIDKTLQRLIPNLTIESAFVQHDIPSGVHYTFIDQLKIK